MTNVILVSIDSLRADVITRQNTPNLWQLGRNGCRFETTIVQAPFTVTSHASILTGLYPFNHGLRKFTGQKLDPKAQTILSYLTRQNYAAQALADVDVLRPEQGFTTGFHHRGCSSSIADVRRAIFQAGKRPFCLFLHYWGVHTPYQTLVPVSEVRDLIGNLDILLKETAGWSPVRLKPAQPYWLQRVNKVRRLLHGGRQQAVWRGYLRAVKQMDRWLGQFLTLLRKNAWLENTILVITADHGECFNEHGEATLRPNAYEHGSFLYDDTVRVQTIFAGPTIPPNRLFSDQIEGVDIVPTIYDLLGLSVTTDPDFLRPDGISLRPLWATNQPGKKQTYSETRKDELNQVMLRTTDYKLIHDKVSGEKMLFDLRSDPNEQTNLAQEASPISRQMQTGLDEFLTTRQQNVTGIQPMSKPELTTVTARFKQLGYLD